MTAALNDSDALRKDMIETCLWMNNQQLNRGTSGNISVRLTDGILITPSGVPYDELTADMLVQLPISGQPRPSGMKPSTEWPFHQRLHQSRFDMPVVLHAHPPYCSAIAVQRREIPACHYMVAAFGGSDVPLVKYELYGSAALADDMCEKLENRHGCLMANHGAVVLGETIARAKWRLQELESLAQTYLLSHIGGVPVILTDNEILKVQGQFAEYGPK